ncbi:hypothetical protein Gasu2_60950 [Galdieria sulphuraria]|uniref:Zinc-finger protein / transcription factor n=1 Tax=Galdieria sulphuraria TaxID=130081 RepID=M2X0Q7_GALSU|nr:zinc-finger protein / transcription factor [Galdieria sulphuraria]EME29930.1 zinc-finger protein / transcription factor [Galdieria sulphuraria]GJD11980.1 hypothetical protein Gasu2_60950 [Galdieria sulphuraria]|eukprot:XP_005706450.1 zinc-finger protein / transcription factor [Galdieria sulphuraria]
MKQQQIIDCVVPKQVWDTHHSKKNGFHYHISISSETSQWVFCACCGSLLRFRISFALIQCPLCLALLWTRPIESCYYQLLYDCEGCGQRLIFPLEATMVQCSICFMLKSFSPPRMSCCQRCGLRLVYNEEKDTNMLFCTVCFGLQPL